MHQPRFKAALVPLNESPSEKEGKFGCLRLSVGSFRALNESPSEKEGKCMRESKSRRYRRSLNESPSEKEGKSEANGRFSSLPYSPQ